ncbi:MAG: hypothetical protein HC853_05630 [Anaerolineae bacterium]|nr:hypothetical protein [Anaerolineae bacterium]
MEDGDIIDPFIVVRPSEPRYDDIPRSDSKGPASNQHSHSQNKLAHLNSLLIKLLHQKSASLSFPYYEVIVEQSVVQSVINGPSKAMLVGETGSGRTTTAMLIAAQQCNSPDSNQAAVILDFKGGKNKLHIHVSDVSRMTYAALSERQQSELKDYALVEIYQALGGLLDAKLLLPIFDHTEWLSDINKSALAKSLAQLNRYLVIVHRDDVAVYMDIGATEIEMPAPSEYEIADYFVRKSDHMPDGAVPGIKKLLARLPTGISPWHKLVVACNHREAYWTLTPVILDAYLKFTVRAADLVEFQEVSHKLDVMKRLAGRIALAVCKENRAVTAKFDKQDFDQWAELQGVASNIGATLREMWLCGWLRRDGDGWRFADAEIAAHCAAPFWLKEFENDKDGRFTMGAEWVPIIASAIEHAKLIDHEKLAKLDKKALKRLNRMATALVNALKTKDDDYLVDLSVKLNRNLDPNVTTTLPTRKAAGEYLLAQLKQLVEMDGSDIERMEFVNHQLRDLDYLIWYNFVMPHYTRVKQLLLPENSWDDSKNNYIARVVRLLDYSEGRAFYLWQLEQLFQRNVVSQKPFGLLPEDEIGVRNICIYSLKNIHENKVIERLDSLFAGPRHWQEEIVAQFMRDPSSHAFELALQYALKTDCIIVRKPENTLDLVKQYGGFISIARATEQLNKILTNGNSEWTREISLLHRLCALSDAHRAKDVLAKVAPYKPKY